MTERDGRDADLDPERFAPRVVPIRGFSLPPPPGWNAERVASADHLDEALVLAKLARTALSPEDYTVTGKLRCTYLRQSDSQRCDNALVSGTTGCSFHNARYAHYHNNTQEAVPHPDDPSKPSKIQETRAERVERIRAHMELAGESAVRAVMSVLEDEGAKPMERLKAAELVLDRTIGRQLQVEKTDYVEKELDVELLELADEILPPTGTDGKLTDG